MAKIKNVSGEARLCPTLGGRLVEVGQVVDVPADDVYGFTCQTAWEPADDDAQAVHSAASPTVPATPSGNAPREAWADWVIERGLADEAALDGMSRNEIRDTFKEQ